MSKRAALYIRVSTDEQVKHGFSIAEQKADLTAYVAAHAYKTVGLYIDEGTSARKSLQRRHEFQRLLKDVASGDIDIIIFKCLDRWIRNVKDYYKVQEILDAHHVGWECTQEEYSTTTTNGRLMLNLKLTIAQNESDQTSDRIRYVFEGLKRQHKKLSGNLPPGYTVDKNRKIVIDEEKAPKVKDIFDRILSHQTIQSVFKLYNINRRKISVMLRNESYLGTFYGVPGYAPPIIDKATFDAVQVILRKNPKSTPSGDIYLFTGLLRCPDCGRRMTSKFTTYRRDGKPVKKYHWYICGRNAINYECNFRKNIRESVIESNLLENLQAEMKSYTAAAQKQANVPDNTKKTAALQDKQERLKYLYVDGMLAREKFKAEYDALQKEIDQMSKYQGAASFLEQAKALGHINVSELYDSLSAEKKREFWRSIIDWIEVVDTHHFKPHFL